MKGGDSVKTRKKRLKNEQGNIMLITAIIILILTIIVASCINISGVQFDLSILNRNTSNTYYLAKSAAEKQVDTINKSIETNLSYMIQELGKRYIKQISNITNKVSASTGGEALYTNLIYNYSSNDKIQIEEATLIADLKSEIYNYIKKYYITDIGASPISYSVASDRAKDGYETTVTIEVKEETPVTDNGFIVVATAETKNGTEIYDKQTVEATIQIHIPPDITNEIHEKYVWAFNAPEVLSAPLTCFSDVVITSGTLTVNGDMLVKGNKKAISTTTNSLGGVTILTSSMDPDESGGVIANKGGKITVNGNLYCNNNVMVSDGWDGTGRANGSSITVSKDVIADTIGIVDDFYENGGNQTPFTSTGQVSGASITISGNAMVENDIMIDRWVNGCSITVEGIILGISDGTGTIEIEGEDDVIDPNRSSGVFSQGSGSDITAKKGIYVAGQPFITLAANTMPMRLFESVGEPFDGVASWEGYASLDGAHLNNSTYLLSDSPFRDIIKRDKIVTVLNNTYAPAQISATTAIGTAGVTQGCSNTVFSTGGTDQAEAAAFFFNGGSSKSFSDVGAEGSYSAAADSLLTNAGLGMFYQGDTSLTGALTGNTWVQNKNFGAASFSEKMGLKGYMIAMRSVFYGKNLDILKFGDVIGTLPTAANAWSYKDPVVVAPTGAIDISKFYVKEGDAAEAAWPTIIINPTDTELEIMTTNSSKNIFNGIIISQGKVSITGPITINGSVIIGGPSGAATRAGNMTGSSSGLIISGDVTINNNPADASKNFTNMLLDVETNNNVLYRKILDALKVTQYSGNTDLKNIFKEYAVPSSKVAYTTGKVFLSNKSFLEVDTKGIAVRITKLYSIN